jgi:hypothetical protein
MPIYTHQTAGGFGIFLHPCQLFSIQPFFISVFVVFPDELRKFIAPLSAQRTSCIFYALRICGRLSWRLKRPAQSPNSTQTAIDSLQVKMKFFLLLSAIAISFSLCSGAPQIS